MKWQYRILELFDVMLYSFEFPTDSAPPPSCAASLGRSRQPQTSAQQADRATVARVLQCILADFELVDRPAGGCSPRTWQPERPDLEQVCSR